MPEARYCIEDYFEKRRNIIQYVSSANSPEERCSSGKRYKLLRMYAVYKVATSTVNCNFVSLQLLTCSCITNFFRTSPAHVGLLGRRSSTSIVKASQIVEPLQPKKGSKSKVNGARVLPATVLEVGGKEKLKKMQTEFHRSRCVMRRCLKNY